MESRSQVLGHLAALFTIFVWGTTFISTKVLLVSFTPAEIMFYRLVLAVMALFILSPVHLSDFKLDSQALRSEWKSMLAGLCGVTLFILFQNTALTYTLTANVSVLISTNPLFTALASRVFLQERLKANFFVGFAAAMAGIILIAFNGRFVLQLNPLGDLLSLLAAFVWAFYSVAIKKIEATGRAMLAVTRKVFFYGLIFTLPTLPLFEVELDLKRVSMLPNLLNLLFLSLVASALCYVTWNYAIQRLGPVRTSSYIYAIPVVTIVASALVLHESITLIAGAGIALILIGMALSERERAP